MSPATIMKDSARVARVWICTDPCCVHARSQQPHLSIDRTEVELDRQNATAISYTWGEFERKAKVIGHEANDSRTQVSMELGNEWILEDFILRLAELGSAKALWMDQLCIPQEDDEIRKALASVPLIYRSFDVVALMPGHPCRCLEDYLQKVDSLPTFEESDAVQWGTTLAPNLRTATNCLNSACDASWFTRVWTRQELLYSREIRVVWAGSEQAKCVRYEQSHPASNIEDLTPFAANFRRALKEQGYNENAAQQQIYQRANTLDQTAMADLEYYVQNQTKKTYRSEQIMRRFLRGDNFRSALPHAEHDGTELSSIKAQLEVFLGGLGRLPRTSLRVATQKRDYVVSIWIDCPRYEVPRAYKDMEITHLLQDALDQFAGKHALTLVTHAPQGLFKAGKGSAKWCADEYLQDVIITDVVKVYSVLPLTDGTTVPLENGTEVSLRRLEVPYPSLAAFIKPSKTVWSEEEIVPRTLKKAVLDWPQTTILNISRHVTEQSRLMTGGAKMFTSWKEFRPLAIACCVVPLLEDHVAFKASGQSVGEIQGAQEMMDKTREVWFEHRYELVYELVAAALGLDEGVCRRHELQIMVAHNIPPGSSARIGMCCKSFNLGRAKEMASKGDLLTVRMAPDRDDSDANWWDNVDGSVLYEVKKLQQQNADTRTAFQVVGVWVPTARTLPSHIGAVVDRTGSDGIVESADAFIA